LVKTQNDRRSHGRFKLKELGFHFLCESPEKSPTSMVTRPLDSGADFISQHFIGCFGGGILIFRFLFALIQYPVEILKLESLTQPPSAISEAGGWFLEVFEKTYFL
jgi:hypothetical protein